MTPLADVPIPPPGPRRVRLDTERLYAALDRRRRAQRLSHREMMRQMGEPNSSAYTRLGQGGQPSVDLFVRMLHWIGSFDATPYVITRDGDQP